MNILKTRVAIFYTQATFDIFLKKFNADDFHLFLNDRIIYHLACSRFNTGNLRKRNHFYRQLSVFLKRIKHIDMIVFHNSTDLSLQLLYTAAAYKTTRWMYVYDGIGSAYYMHETPRRLLLKCVLCYVYLRDYKHLPFNFTDSYNVAKITDLVPQNSTVKPIEHDFSNFEAFIIIGNTDIDYGVILEELKEQIPANCEKFFVKHPLEKDSALHGFARIDFDELARLSANKRIFVVSEISTVLLYLLSKDNVILCVARRRAHHVDYQMRYFNIVEKVIGSEYNLYYIC